VTIYDPQGSRPDEAYDVPRVRLYSVKKKSDFLSPLNRSCRHVTIFLALALFRIRNCFWSNASRKNFSLLYILWTVHRDTYTWERPTSCTLISL